MTAPGTVPVRGGGDTNLYEDINLLQEQIGDLTSVLEEFGDLCPELDDTGSPTGERERPKAESLVDLFKSLRNKLFKPNTPKVITTIDWIDDGTEDKIEITTSTNHSLSVDQKIVVTGTDGTNYIGFYIVTSVESSTVIRAINKAGSVSDAGSETGGELSVQDGFKGKIMQHGSLLIPSGAVFIIAGNYNSDGWGRDIVGQSACPDGYINCESVIVSDANSEYDDFITNLYSPDCRGITFRGYGNGVNNFYKSDATGDTYFDPDLVLNDVGTVMGTDTHKHGLEEQTSQSPLPSYTGHKHRMYHKHKHKHEIHTHTHDGFIHPHSAPITHSHKGSHEHDDDIAGRYTNQAKKNFNEGAGWYDGDKDQDDLKYHKHIIDYFGVGDSCKLGNNKKASSYPEDKINYSEAQVALEENAGNVSSTEFSTNNDSNNTDNSIEFDNNYNGASPTYSEKPEDADTSFPLAIPPDSNSFSNAFLPTFKAITLCLKV